MDGSATAKPRAFPLWAGALMGGGGGGALAVRWLEGPTSCATTVFAGLQLGVLAAVVILPFLSWSLTAAPAWLLGLAAAGMAAVAGGLAALLIIP